MTTQHPLHDDLNHVLQRTGALFRDLRGKKIFLTGGTGFFGKWLLESFVWANRRLGLKAQLYVLSREPHAFRGKFPHLASECDGIFFQQGDVRTFPFPAERYDYIIHAATEASARLNRDNPLLMLETIVDGTRRVLDLASHCRADRVLLTSSGAVYGTQPPECSHLPEEYCGAPSPLLPGSAYGEGKRLAELLCTIYRQEYGLNTVIARCFAFVGPYLPLDTHYAIGNFIRDGLAGGTIAIAGDGTPKRSYLYAADLAIWLWTLLLQGTPGEAYNVGAETAVSIRELANLVGRAFTPAPAVTVAGVPVPGRPPQQYVPSTRKARNSLGLHTWVDLDAAIRKTICWHQHQRPPAQHCSGRKKP